MKNFNIILILLGILSGAILIVENMVLNQQAYVYIYYSEGWVLTMVSIVTGMILGFGIKGQMLEKGNASDDDDSFNF